MQELAQVQFMLKQYAFSTGKVVSQLRGTAISYGEEGTEYTGTSSLLELGTAFDRGTAFLRDGVLYFSQVQLA